MEAISARAFDEIQMMIFEKELVKGQKISETALEKRLNMSRTPIRKALTMLQNDGLIEMKENCYTRIADYDPEYIRQFGIARLTLDVEAVKLAVLNGSDADYARLNDYCETYEQAVADNSSDAQKAIMDCHFHRQISVIGKNPILTEVIDGMYKRAVFFTVYSDFNAADKNRSLRQHQDIMRALKRRDITAAVNAVKRHLYDFYDLDDRQTLL